MVQGGSVQNRLCLPCSRWDWQNVAPRGGNTLLVSWSERALPQAELHEGVPGDTAISGTHSLKDSKNAKINTFQKLFEMRPVPWSLMSSELLYLVRRNFRLPERDQQCLKTRPPR